MTRKVAMVTGAASGIGQALAVAFARQGVAVAGGYYPADPHDPDETRRLVEEAGGECLMLPLDVTFTASVDDLAAAAIKAFGRIDYAVANAGLLRRAPLLEMTDERWNEMLDVDLTGVMRTFRSAVRHMGEGGALVAISSIAGGVYGWQDHSHYAAAKAGVIGFSKSLALEVAKDNVLVNAIAPGPIETPLVAGISSAWKTAKAAELPLGRFGLAEEVAPVAVLLASEPGGNLFVGQTLGPNSGDVMP
ncbi:short-chain dehydrogenase [Pseudomonas syringae pv. actinidiae]|nr:short-chain dehydrogenase [Pseudomonas syringae pv. actinidiae]